MAFDKNQLFDDGDTAITQDGKSPEKLLVGPGEYDVTVIVTTVSASDTIVVTVEESQDGTTFNDLSAFPEIDAPGIFHRKVQTQKEYLQLGYNVDGSQVSIKLVAGITRGRDGGANA